MKTNGQNENVATMVQYFLSSVISVKGKWGLSGNRWKTVHLLMSGTQRSSSSVSMFIRIEVLFCFVINLNVIQFKTPISLFTAAFQSCPKCVQISCCCLPSLKDGLQGCFFAGLGISYLSFWKVGFRSAFCIQKMHNNIELSAPWMLHFPNERGNQNALSVRHQ